MGKALYKCFFFGTMLSQNIWQVLRPSNTPDLTATTARLASYPCGHGLPSPPERASRPLGTLLKELTSPGKGPRPRYCGMLKNYISYTTIITKKTLFAFCFLLFVLNVFVV